MEINRYKYYRLGQDAESANKFEEAIEFYSIYSSYLEDKDKHIPLLWIHNILFDLEKPSKAKEYLLRYCEGCSYPYAFKTLKEKALLYDKINCEEISRMLNNKAKEYQKKQSDLLKQKM